MSTQDGFQSSSIALSLLALATMAAVSGASRRAEAATLDRTDEVRGAIEPGAGPPKEPPTGSGT